MHASSSTNSLACAKSAAATKNSLGSNVPANHGEYRQRASECGVVSASGTVQGSGLRGRKDPGRGYSADLGSSSPASLGGVHSPGTQSNQRRRNNCFRMLN